MNIRLATGKITVVARDEEQAMHAGGGENDGVGESEPDSLANENGLLTYGFVDFEQITVVEHGSPARCYICGLGANEKFDPHNARYDYLVVSLHFGDGRLNPVEALDENIGVEKRVHPRRSHSARNLRTYSMESKPLGIFSLPNAG